MRQPRFNPAEELRAARDERDRFDALYRRHAPAMWRTAWQVLRQQEDAWDVVQRAFVKVMEKPEQIRGLGSVEAWLITVARNEALDLWRRRRPQRPLDEAQDEDTRQPDPQSRMLADEGLRRLDAALSRLSDEEQELLRLRVQENLDHEAIASVLGKRAGAVRVALHRARRRLEALMEDSDETR